jgi:hypothetical protein
MIKIQNYYGRRKKLFLLKWDWETFHLRPTRTTTDQKNLERWQLWNISFPNTAWYDISFFPGRIQLTLHFISNQAWHWSLKLLNFYLRRTWSSFSVFSLKCGSGFAKRWGFMRIRTRILGSKLYYPLYWSDYQKFILQVSHVHVRYRTMPTRVLFMWTVPSYNLLTFDM